jgi:hypothetical protein
MTGRLRKGGGRVCAKEDEDEEGGRGRRRRRRRRGRRGYKGFNFRKLREMSLWWEPSGSGDAYF